MQAKAAQDWLELFRDVEAALDDPEIAKGLNQMYADRPNWPAEMQERMAPFRNPKVWEFMARVLKCEGLSKP